MPISESSFVLNPPGRGTLGLLWECLFTIFLSAWTAIHQDTPPPGSLQKARLSKLKWCLIVLLFPELAFQYILTEFISAYRFRDRYNRAAARRTRDELLHSEPCSIRNILGDRSNSTKWNLKHGYLVIMGALQFRFGNSSAKFLTQEGFEKLAECNMLPCPEFLNERIKRRQKSDFLSKMIVCIQMLWMATQTIARRVDGLPITLLELNTLAQAWFALSVYVLWLQKPQGLEDPIEVDFSSCQDCRQFLESNDIGFVDKPPEIERVGSFKQFIFFMVIDGVVSLVYIGIHASGWNAAFPTHVEMILWRVAVGIFVVSLAMFAVWALIVWCSYDGKADQNDPVMVIIVIALACARIVFIIEAFISLRSLPPGSYSTPTWSDLLPHIG